MVHIRRLREKIEKEPSRPEYLINVKGLGYKLVIKMKIIWSGELQEGF